MIFIGERINAGFKDVKAAVINHDADIIKDWALRQTKAGATYLDVCLGTASAKIDDFLWMIDTVQSTVQTPISIDNNKVDMIQEAIKICKKPPLVNSVPLIEEKMAAVFPLVAEHNASIIGLVMDETGSPKSADKRIENAGMLLARAMDFGLEPDQLFLDPIVMPLKFMQDQCKEIMSAASQFSMLSDPSPHIVCGLTNISNGGVHKKLINRIFCAMMVANGLDAVILDMMDTELVDAILTAELAMNRSIYADAYLEAFHGGN